MTTIDFGRHSEEYATYRPGFPPSFFRRLEAIVPLHESHVIDLATGPGTIALELGSLDISVVGIDISQKQIATAKRVAKERNLEEKVCFMVASAEHTGLNAKGFDLATAGQCWHWFDTDAVMMEVQRILRPGGVLVIAYYTYLVGLSGAARDTEELILEFNPSWTMAGCTGIFPEQIDDLMRGGFEFFAGFCDNEEEEFSHERWRGRMRTCNGVGSGGLSPLEVERFDEALGRLLKE